MSKVVRNVLIKEYPTPIIQKELTNPLSLYIYTLMQINERVKIVKKGENSVCRVSKLEK